MSVHKIEAREAEYTEPESPLPDVLSKVLIKQGIKQLYTHQAESRGTGVDL